MTIITSAENPIIKDTARLRERKHRDASGLFVIEGVKFVGEIPDGRRVEYYLLSEQFCNGNGIDAYINRAKTYAVSDRLFAKVSDVVNPQGVLAVCEKKEYILNNLLDNRQKLLLVLENIQDPGNVGTLLRTADAFGAGGVVMFGDCADVYGPKVLRSAAGSVFRLPFVQSNDTAKIMNALKWEGFKVYAAHPRDGVPPGAIDFSGRCAIIIGNEANGITDGLLARCDKAFCIQMKGKAESLNASIAGGILMYEATKHD